MVQINRNAILPTSAENDFTMIKQMSSFRMCSFVYLQSKYNSPNDILDDVSRFKASNFYKSNLFNSWHRKLTPFIST